MYDQNDLDNPFAVHIWKQLKDNDSDLYESATSVHLATLPAGSVVERQGLNFKFNPSIVDATLKRSR